MVCGIAKKYFYNQNSILITHKKFNPDNRYLQTQKQKISQESKKITQLKKISIFFH